MTINQLRLAAGMTQKEYAAYFGVPLRSVEDWCTDKHHCPDYLTSLMEYKLRREGLIPNAEDNQP